MKDLKHLAELLTANREALLAKWRELVRALPSACNLDTPTLNDHIPVLITEITAALERDLDEDEVPEAIAAGSSPEHGTQRVDDGYDIEEVVAEYNILRDCIHDLADQHGLIIHGQAFRLLNGVIDAAIGEAVKTFSAQQAREVQRRREEYLAFIAHDLRTPLSAITLASRLLELRLAPETLDAANTRMLKTLRRNVDHLETLVASVLRENTQLITELGVKPERRVFDLWPMVEGLILDLQPMAIEKRTEVVNDVPDDVVMRADAGLIRRVLQNLLANAIEYTSDGRVTIGARMAPAEGEVECWVTDTGAGIPPDLIGSVFEPLATDPTRDGTGLGLAIVKTFIEAHDGRVSVESRVGHGSTFRFTLPPKAAAANLADHDQHVAVGMLDQRL